MRAQVLFVALLAVVAVAAADVETSAAAAADADPKAVDSVAPEKPKTFKPHMHRRGALRSGHVRPYPVGYDTAKYRHDVRWRNGGVAMTTEQLLKRFPQADTRVSVNVPSADRRASAGAYDWETPEYEFEYVARTGEDVRGRRPRRQPRQNLPVVHYPRRVPQGGRRARTPRAEGGAARKQRKAGGKKVVAQKPKGKRTRTASQRLDRLEKVMTFALRQLKRNLKRSKRLEKFAVKSKKAISLIARALSGDEKGMKLSTQHIELLRRAALKTKTQLQNLHARSKLLASASKKHKKVIQTIASELVGTQKTQNQIIDNVKALRKAALSAEKGLRNLDVRSKASTVMLAAHAQKIVKNEKNVAAATQQSKVTQFNVKALHDAAVNAQKAILNVDARLVTATRNAAKQKKALQIAFNAISKAAAKKSAKKF